MEQTEIVYLLLGIILGMLITLVIHDLAIKNVNKQQQNEKIKTTKR
tara:strand:- start:197 stop:334 length:138 start_codon:yes stop_codon:yes gene_type:complete